MLSWEDINYLLFFRSLHLTLAIMKLHCVLARVLLLILTFGVLLVHGYRTGADPVACGDMRPGHIGQEPQRVQPPYNLNVSHSKYTGGQVVRGKYLINSIKHIK